MDCSCTSLDCDDGPSLYEELWRKAKRIHKCCECRKDILPGMSYQYISGIWEGGFEHYKTCKECTLIINDFFCGTREFERLADYLLEHYDVEL